MKPGLWGAGGRTQRFVCWRHALYQLSYGLSSAAGLWSFGFIHGPWAAFCVILKTALLCSPSQCPSLSPAGLQAYISSVP